MPPKKRKASASVEKSEAAPTKKLTKKELRAQAILRAKQSMQADKERVESVKAKKQQEAGAETRPSKRRKVQPVEEKKKVEKKKPASPKKKAATPKKKAATPKKKAAASPKKSPKTKSAKVATASNADVAAGTPKAQVPLQPMPTGIASPPYNGQISPAMMTQYMMSQQGGRPVSSMAYGNPYMMQQQAYGGGYAYGAPTYASSSSMQVPVQPKVQPPAKAKSPAKPRKKTVRKKAVKAPPPTASLEMQISQQAMANCAAASKNQPPPYGALEAFQPSSHQEIDEEPIVVDSEGGPNRKKTWGRRLIAVIAGTVLIYFFMDNSSLYSPGAYSLSDEPPCFTDTKLVYDENGEITSVCPDGAPCPTGGVCENGVLVDCTSSFYHVSENKGGCILSKDTNETLSTMMTILEEWTVEKKCQLLSYGKAMPLFEYSEVQLVNPVELATNPLDLSILETEFLVEQRENGIYLGLKKAPKLPFTCLIGSLIKSSFENFGGFLLSCFFALIVLIGSCFEAYPIASLVVLVIALIVRRIQKYRNYRSKLKQDIAQVREMTYNLLQEAPESHVVLHVRDEISMDLYPSSRSQRQYLAKEVWPRVVPDIYGDNRVRKSSKVIEGKPRDVWQWVAAASAKKRQ